MMLISEFCRATGLSQDTVRFYVRKGLLTPATGRKGGSNPYQIFTAEDVANARIIRLAQGLGFSLREISALKAEYDGGGMTPARSAEIMQDQLSRLEEKAAELDTVMRYLRAKIGWIEAGSPGPEPVLGDYAACLPEPLAEMSLAPAGG